MYLTYALKELGPSGVTIEHRRRIKELLKSEDKDKMLADAAIIPGWIIKIITES